ncbi:hypothetical protein CANARDRAFT_7597 [[Candida] arabinofermentans NRRL YB-2248]|uniref:Amino acid permease/ SLC12A domain-containing protein n=1 Tax=[Candida] arabinofermentans NRRL YB-2248 TaxID=983967 RepID=A0A1E4T155_9ASCO|nr:hypothetical protein CANARDRAFT_7597 [[Candida] arabinofermentans NRRL YB-2248]
MEASSSKIYNEGSSGSSSNLKRIENFEIDEISSVDDNGERNTSTKRGLKSRHVQLIALAGAIGTGLFVGSGSSLSTCGPAALLIGYLVLCVFVWFMMNQLGEMVSFIPAPGKSTMYSLCERYTGNKSLAFAAGINLFYAQALLVPAEISAAAFVVQYWSDLNVAIWISIFWVSIVALNLLAVKVFGETEFWIASIKIFTIVGLIIVGIVIFFGGAPAQHHVLGFHYWKTPGAFTEHLASGNTGKFLACWTAIIKSAFAFILSPELITSCAAEAEAPRINLPKATSRFIYRLMAFYIGGILVIGVIVAYDDDRLMSAISNGSSGAAASPFVIGIQNAGIKVLNHIVNAAILTSAYSAGNSFTYAASRTLHSMALTGDIPRVLATCNKSGVPYYAVTITAAISLLAYLNVSNSSTIVFTWLSNISTVSGFISWILVSITYLRYRKAITYHGLDNRVTYRPPLQIIGAYASLFFFTLISITNGYAVFFDWSTSDFFAAYITLPIIALLYVGHMLFTKNFRLFAHPQEIDCFTGLEETEAEAASYVAPVPKNFIQRLWFWIA